MIQVTLWEELFVPAPARSAQRILWVACLIKLKALARVIPSQREGVGRGFYKGIEK